MTRFVGCIDLHDGQVKQIVGGTLTDNMGAGPKTNYISSEPSSYYAHLYRKHNVTGSHIIKLGPGNDEAALEALAAEPGFLQVGGGINLENCEKWLEAGASKVIVTSALFSGSKLNWDYLQSISKRCQGRLCVDLSCRRVLGSAPGSEDRWVVAMNRWQTLTDLELSKKTFEALSQYSDEFLVHAADVEGLCQGVDHELVERLAQWTKDLPDIRIVYAGGARSKDDLELVNRLSNGRIDLTFGSSLDIFGGSLVRFADCCQWNDEH